jgi:hypothetical protein
MTSLLRLALLSLLPLLAGCDNVGRAFDPSVEPPAPPPGSTVQTIHVPVRLGLADHRAGGGGVQ